MNNRSLFCIMLLISTLVFIGIQCPQSPDDDDDLDNPIQVSAPTNVTAIKDTNSNNLIVDWNSSENGAVHEVFRVINGESALLAERTATSYFDSSYPVNVDIQYKVRSTKDDVVSDFSPISFAVTVPLSVLVIENLAATTLEFDNMIKITWFELTQDGVNPAYALKRYKTKADYEENSDNGTDLIVNHDDLTIEDGTVMYEDITAIMDTAYYYIVDWIDLDDGTNGLDSSFVFGIYGNGDDHQYENNDDRLELPEETTIFPIGTDLIIYSFNDEGVTDQDIDWYVYRGVPQNIEITITSALVGKIRLDFYYNNQTVQGTILNYSPRTYNFSKLMFSDPSSTNPDILYFEISPVSGQTNFIGTYSISTNY